MLIHALFSALCFSFQVRKNKPFHTFMLMTLRVGKKEISPKMQIRWSRRETCRLVMG